MPNVFDQFDAPKSSKNVFDQFDAPQSQKADGGQAKSEEVSTWKDVAYQGLEGFNRGLDTILSAPANLNKLGGQLVGDYLVDPLMSSLGVEKPKTPETEAYDKQLRTPTSVLGTIGQTLGTDVYSKNVPAQTKTGRIAEKTGEIIGGDAPFAALTGGISLSRPIINELSVPAKTVLGNLGKSIVSSSQQAPARVAIGELAASTGAGTFMGLAEENKASIPMQMLAGTIGALSPSALSLAPTRMALRAGSEVAKRILPAEELATKFKDSTNFVGKRVAAYTENLAKMQKQKAESAASKQLITELQGQDPGDLTAKNIESSIIEKEIPGLNLSLAEKTEIPRLVETQKAVSETMKPERVYQELERRADNLRAVEDARAEFAPKVPYDPDMVINLADNKVKSNKKAFDDYSAMVDKEESDLIYKYGETKDKLRSQGEELRKAISDKRAQTKQNMSALATELGLNDENALLDVSGLKNDLVELYRSASKLKVKQEKPQVDSSEPAGFLDFGNQKTLNTQTEKQPVSFGGDNEVVSWVNRLEDNQSIDALTQLRSDISERLEAARRGASALNATDRRGLDAMLKRIDGYIDTIGSDVADELGQKYQQFRQAYKTDYIDKFETGATYKTLQKGRRRDYKTRDEMVAKSYFKPGDEQAALQFKAIFGGDQAANNAIKNVAIDSLFNNAFVQGKINQTAFNRWMNNHKTVLEYFPDIKNAVKDIETATQAFASRRAEALANKKQIEQSVLAKELEKYSSGTYTAEDLIQRAVKNPKRMKELINALPSEESKVSLQRVVWDNIFDQPNPMQYIQKHDQILRSTLGTKSYNSAKNLLRAVEKINIVPPPVGTGLSSVPTIDKLENFLNMGMASISSRIFAAESGRTSARFVGVNMMSNFLRGYSKRQADNILMEAMLDPDLAKRLIDGIQNPKNVQNLKRLYTYLFSIGLGADGQDKQSQNQR